MMIRLIIAATRISVPLALLSGFLVCALESARASAEPLALFTATPGANAKLAASATSLPGGLTIRLPRGYAFFAVPKGDPSKGETVTAFRASNPDGTYPVFVIVTETAPTAMLNANDEAAMVAGAISGLAPEKKQDWKNFQEASAVTGTLDGTQYQCVSYHGTTTADGATTPHPARGLMYVGVDEGALVLIMAEDTSPYVVDSQPLQIAAALSLKRQAPAPAAPSTSLKSSATDSTAPTAPVAQPGLPARTPVGTSYTVELPNGLSAQPSAESTPGAKETLFTSPLHADGDLAMMMFITEDTVDDGSNISDDLTGMLRTMVSDMKHTLTSATNSPIDHCTINGMTFARIHLTGLHKLDGYPRPARESQVMLAGWDNSNDCLIAIVCSDSAPTSTQTLPRMEAAALTLARKG